MIGAERVCDGGVCLAPGLFTPSGFSVPELKEVKCVLSSLLALTCLNNFKV